MPLDQLSRIHSHLASRGFEMRPLVIKPRATEQEIQSVESTLGIRLPPTFRDVLLNISSEVEFWWQLPEDFARPHVFRENFSGDLRWSLDSLEQREEDRKEWVESCFPDPESPYDAVWWNKLPFSHVPNGDLLAIDLRPDCYEQIVYLSHDDGEGHGYVMAENFRRLLDRWIPLACTGAEDWQWLPFTQDATSGIDPDCENARQWRTLLGIE